MLIQQCRYHQLTRIHKVLEAKQHGIAVSSSFEIQPVLDVYKRQFSARALMIIFRCKGFNSRSFILPMLGLRLSLIHI